MDEQINVEPGVKGVITKAKANAKGYYDWLLIISHIATETIPTKLTNMIYCHACVCLNQPDRCLNEVRKKPIRFGDISHYNFYKPTEEEINMIKEFLKQKNLKFIKGINKMFDR